MSDLIPPMPNGVVPGSGFWNDWFEKLRTIINLSLTSLNWSIITGKPTTLSGYGITDGQATTQKGVAGGYAALNSVSRTPYGVQAANDDLVVQDSSKGLVLKSPNGHYWRLSINNTGVVSGTDLGTTSP